MRMHPPTKIFVVHELVGSREKLALFQVKTPAQITEILWTLFKPLKQVLS